MERGPCASSLAAVRRRPYRSRHSASAGGSAEPSHLKAHRRSGVLPAPPSRVPGAPRTPASTSPNIGFPLRPRCARPCRLWRRSVADCSCGVLPVGVSVGPHRRTPLRRANARLRGVGKPRNVRRNASLPGGGCAGVSAASEFLGLSGPAPSRHANSGPATAAAHSISTRSSMAPVPARNRQPPPGVRSALGARSRTGGPEPQRATEPGARSIADPGSTASNIGFPLRPRCARPCRLSRRSVPDCSCALPPVSVSVGPERRTPLRRAAPGSGASGSLGTLGAITRSILD
jgi:hypothetical protein